MWLTEKNSLTLYPPYGSRMSCGSFYLKSLFTCARRKALPISLLILLTAGTGFAQKVEWDSVSRPEIYPSRVAMYRSFKHSRKDIVFLGNSITFWAEWGELLDKKHIKNRGIPGDITFGVLERLDEVIGGQPDKVFILIGINDIARNIPDSIIIDNYKRMISRIRAGSARTEIFFQTMLPTNSSFNKLKAHYRNDRIRQINEKLKELTAKENVTLIDLHPHFTDDDGNLIKEYTFDGVHLNKLGYDKWKEILEKGKYLK